MEQTAVGWLYKELYGIPRTLYEDQLIKIFEQAKEMEKDHIAEAYEIGWINGDLKKAPSMGEDYYEDKYSHPDPSDEEIYNDFNHEGGIKYP